MTRKPALLVLTQFYDPEPNFITADVAERLARHFEVTVLTPHANYPLDWFYPGTRRWWWPRRTVERGVTVCRLPLVPYHGRSILRRGVCYLSFAGWAAVVAPFVAARARVVWVYHGPFTVGLAALWFRWVLGARVVITAADLWPESLLASDVAREGWLIRLAFSYSRWINRIAHVIVCATRGTLARYAQDGCPESSLRYVPVWVRGVDRRRPSHVAPPDLDRRIVYAGNLGPAQGLETVVRGAAELHRRGRRVSVHFYGSGGCEMSLRVLAERVGAANVNFHGRVPVETAFDVSVTAFAQVVSLQGSPLFAMTIPSKLAFCFAAGAPILAALPGEGGAVARESGGAISFDAADPATFVAAVEDLLGRSDGERATMHHRMQHYYDQQFARERLLGAYEEIFTKLAGLKVERQEDAGPPATV